ncbi:hypothetical protein DICVIV_02863 [Dictyocaulus viviparus]|uniref:RRM domain-containing protein n=1 Tax=Dictyocaulus viviparus TaxID=29172 RepID=A0A0D8Y2S2_DICVI|nr:hypothetical protein DICVIV_02863 [Dictyocaulus viviparus]
MTLGDIRPYGMHLHELQNEIQAMGFEDDPVKKFKGEKTDHSYLINTPMSQLTLEEVQKLRGMMDTTCERLRRITQMSWQDAWLADLQLLEKMGDEDDRTCYVCNFTTDVTTDLLEELFTQVGPVEKVALTDKNSHRFAMISFEDEESVPFAVETLDGISLFNIPLRVKPRNGSKHDSTNRSVVDAKRSESSDDPHLSWQSNSRKRDNIGKIISNEEHISNSAPMPPVTVVDSCLPLYSDTSPSSRTFSTSHCKQDYTNRSKFTKRPDSDRRRTFPAKPSENRMFENVS